MRVREMPLMTPTLALRAANDLGGCDRHARGLVETNDEGFRPIGEAARAVVAKMVLDKHMRRFLEAHEDRAARRSGVPSALATRPDSKMRL